MDNKIRNKRNAHAKFYTRTWYGKVCVLKPRKPTAVLFAIVVFFLILMAGNGNTSQTIRGISTPEIASITVNAQNVVRLRPFGVGGTNITNHSYGVNFVNGKNGIDFQADAHVAKLPLIRVFAYPDNRSTNGIDFFDSKVNAVLSSGAQPLLGTYIGSSVNSHQPTGSSVGPYYNLDGTRSNGTVATNVVYMVKHYMAPPYNLQKQYWEIGNEPNIDIDSYATPQLYSQIFNSVHSALVAAGVRDNVILMGPVLSGGYPDGNYFDAFMAHSGQYVDIIDYHAYSGAENDSGLLNTPQQFDNYFDVFRPFDFNAGLNIIASDQANADYGDAPLLYRMDRVPFGRPNVGTALTEHNGYTKPPGGNDVHGIASGLYNLAITHFMLYNPRGLVDMSFMYDQVCDYQTFGHYDCNNQRNYSWYALYIRNNYTGPFVLEQFTTGNLNTGVNNSSGNPYLFVTATRDDSYMYLEVINRNTSAPITVPVTLNGVGITLDATLYTMAGGIFPDASNGTPYTVRNNFTYTFPAESATIFKIPIAPPTDFVVTATAVSQMVNPGNTTTYTVTSTPTGGFVGDVSFSVSGLPPQSSASFSAPTVTGKSGNVMSVTTDVTTPNGDYPLTITGTSNGVLHTYAVMLRVATPDFDFVSNNSVSVGTGSSATLQTTVVPKGGFASIVNFSVGGLPSGVTLDPATLDSGGPIKLRFRADTTVAPGSYPITITASSDTLSHTNPATLTVSQT